MKMGLYFYFKKLDLAILPLTTKNKDEVLPEGFSGKKLPICMDESNGKYTDDMLETEQLYEKTSDVKLDCSDAIKKVGADIYSQFMNYLKKQSPELLQKIKDDIAAIEGQLSKSGGPYINGDSPSIADCIVYPKLYHIKNFFEMTQLAEVISESVCPGVQKYYEMMSDLPNAGHLTSSIEDLFNYFKSKGAEPKIFKKKK